MTRFDDLIERKRKLHGEKFSTSDLAPQFIEHFNSGARVEVEFGYGEIKRGRIGITTGCKPVFLLMLRRSDHGSSHTLLEEDKVIKWIAA